MDICCFLLFSISFPIFWKQNPYLLWGTHSLWLRWAHNQASPPESHSVQATAIAEWAWDFSQAKESPQQNFWNYWKEGCMEIPRTMEAWIWTRWRESVWGETRRLAEVEKELSSDVILFWRPSIQLCLKPALPLDFKVLWANKVPFLFKIIELGFCPD